MKIISLKEAKSHLDKHNFSFYFHYFIYICFRFTSWSEGSSSRNICLLRKGNILPV